MKLIFFSDLHNDIESLNKLLNKEQGEFYCLGDSCLDEEKLKMYNIKSVKGNCDRCKLNEEIILEVDNNKMLLLHGHKQHVKFGLNKLYYYTQSLNCNVVLFGHTHRVYEMDETIKMFNPGSLRDGQTYIVYENNKFTFKRL